MKFLLPLILFLVGSGAGVGAALVFFPPPEPEVDADAEKPEEIKEVKLEEPPEREAGTPPVGRSYVRLQNQFVVPIVEDGRVASLVVISLSLEVEEGFQTTVFDHVPKIRDLFLQTLFDHANTGGFKGVFTQASNMEHIRRSLLAAAQTLLGKKVYDVLIFDVARQDN